MYGLISLILVVAGCVRGDIAMVSAASVFAVADAIGNIFRAKS